jgi:hypothetical protein
MPVVQLIELLSNSIGSGRKSGFLVMAAPLTAAYYYYIGILYIEAILGRDL